MSTETTEATMLSDEELAELAYEAWGEVAPYRREQWLRVVDELRHSLLPEVAPLRPGETVTIGDSLDPDGRLRIADLEDLDGTHEIRIDAESENNWATLYLDAAGVATLIETCRRWQAAQEGDK